MLRFGGCSLVRDIHDERYVEDVKAGSYTFEGSGGSTGGLIDSQEDVGGWPEYRTYNSYLDGDEDGIPDGWLEQHFPGKKADELNEEGYTYLELYLHSLVAHLMGEDTDESTDNQQHPPQPSKIVVDQQGEGDFLSLQEAIDAVRAIDPDYSTVIYLKEGIYYEKVVIPEYLRNLKIVGENRIRPSSPTMTMPG